MSYDVTPSPPGADPEKWAAHQSGTCGGYYRCQFCAAVISAAKQLEADAFRGPLDPPRRRRAPTRDAGAAARRRRAARKARKAQRRRARG